jgi:hypothetical protein
LRVIFLRKYILNVYGVCDWLLRFSTLKLSLITLMPSSYSAHNQWAVWLYKLILSLWYFKGNCSRYCTVNGMCPSTHSFILEVKFRGTCLSEVPKPLQSGLVCGWVLASMSKTWLVTLRVIHYWSRSFVISTTWINVSCKDWERWHGVRYCRARNAKL